MFEEIFIDALGVDDHAKMEEKKERDAFVILEEQRRKKEQEWEETESSIPWLTDWFVVLLNETIPKDVCQIMASYVAMTQFPLCTTWYDAYEVLRHANWAGWVLQDSPRTFSSRRHHRDELLACLPDDRTDITRHEQADYHEIQSDVDLMLKLMLQCHKPYWRDDVVPYICSEFTWVTIDELRSGCVLMNQGTNQIELDSSRYAMVNMLRTATDTTLAPMDRLDRVVDQLNAQLRRRARWHPMVEFDESYRRENPETAPRQNLGASVSNPSMDDMWTNEPALSETSMSDS